MVSVDDEDITYNGLYITTKDNSLHHVAEAANGMLVLICRPFCEADVDIDIWQYRYYVDFSYVSNLFALSAETWEAWRGQYMVQEDAKCWDRAILLTLPRYMNRYESVFRVKEVKWERLKLSRFGPFFLYHLCCIYGLRESARGQLAVRISPN